MLPQQSQFLQQQPSQMMQQQQNQILQTQQMLQQRKVNKNLVLSFLLNFLTGNTL